MGRVTFMAPTKVPVTMDEKQLVSSLGMALFGDPSEIEKATGKKADEIDFYILKTIVGKADEKTEILEVCYDDEDGRHVYDDRGELYIRWYKLVQAIIPGVEALKIVEEVKRTWA